MSSLLEALGEKSGLDKTKAFHNHIKQKAWENGIPLMGSFELTPQCTLDCKMCYVHLRKDQMKKRELETEQWISLIDQACEAGMMFATLTGGECLMYPGFKQIYKHLQEKGILITVLTNGTLLDEETVSWLAKRPPQRIQISVYGSSPAGYKAVTGSADAFYKVDRAIELIKAAGIPFTLAITVTKQSYQDFEAVFKYCQSKSPIRCDVNSIQFDARIDTGRSSSDYLLTLDQQVEIAKIHFKLIGKSNIPYNCEEELLNNKESSNHISGFKGIGCIAGRCSFAICWDGKMLPCNTFGFTEAYPLEEGFINSWAEINKKSAEYRKPIECLSCAYYNACLHCPAIHWSSVGEGHCNPDICNEGKRMALEGIRKL